MREIGSSEIVAFAALARRHLTYQPAGVVMTLSEYALLAQLASRSKPISNSELAAAARKSASSTSRSIDLLVARKWVLRSFVQTGQRRYGHISITEAGLDIFEKETRTRSRALARLYDVMSVSEFNALATACVRLADPDLEYGDSVRA